MIGMFIAETKNAEKVVADVKEVERKYRMDVREAAYKHIKEMYKGCSFDKIPQKKRRRTYCILNRSVTPLIFANEKLVESFLSVDESVPRLGQTGKECSKEIPEAVQIEDRIDKLTLEDMMPDLQMQRRPSKSVNVKRTYLEMNRVRTVPSDLFSIEALKSIFTFVDYESIKFATPHYIVVGHLAAIMFEISSAELRKLNELVASEMGYEEINLRVIKPFKQFYNELVGTALKYGVFNLHTVNSADFVDAAAHAMKTAWKPSLKVPTEAFLELCKSEAAAAKSKDISLFFENLKYRLQEVWDAEIIQKSNDFKKAKVEQN